MNAKEIEIPVPWGIIAAKTWGFDTDPIILMLHGLEDNANTFDYLVCKLPHEYYYVSIDLPGHGKSDNLPSLGLPLQAMDYVYVIKLLVDHFNRDKCIIIGHSFGAILAIQYGLIYPEKLDKLFVLDSIWYQIVKPEEFGSWTRDKFEKFGQILSQIPRTAKAEFTYDECRDMMSYWRYNNSELTPKAVDALLKRAVKQCGNGKYKFTRDPKLKNYLCYPLDPRYISDLLNSHKITFKLVILITKNQEKNYGELCPTVVEAFKKISDWKSIEGNHHVHLNDPDVVANVINGYIDESMPV